MQSTQQLAFSFLEAEQQENAEVIVLLHGGGGSRYDWIDQGITERLGKEYSILVPDLPKHGESRDHVSFSLDCCADAIHQLIATQLSPRGANLKVHLVGFSLGGYAALVTAQKYPHLFESLYLTGVYDMYTVWGRATYAAPFVSIIEHYAVPNFVVRSVTHKFGYTLSDRVTKIAHDTYSYSRSRAVWRELRALELPPRGSTETQRRWQLKTRSMLISGAMHDDKVATSKLGQTLREGNRQSKCYALEGMPHMWYAKDPDLFAHSLKAWIKNELPPACFTTLEASS